MINYQDALTIIRSELKKQEIAIKIPLKIYEEETITEEFGWIFFYQSKEFIESENPGAMLGGNAPLIVDNKTGEVVITGTGKDVDFYIELYKQNRGNILRFNELKRQ